MLKKIFLIFFISEIIFATDFLVVQSTTSTADSGFYDYLLPMYESKTGVDIRVVAVGTGQAIKNAENGDGDLLIVHSKSDEDIFVEKGFGISRKPLMYNDFIIIGPNNDPQKLRGSKNISDLFNTIKIKNLSFNKR